MPSSTPTFRRAREEEDVRLSYILHNAFNPVWNHNWFQNLSEPLDPIPVGVDDDRRPKLTSLQTTRAQFYLAILKITRLLNGLVLVADVPALGSTKQSTDVGAILMWLGPKQRLGELDLSTLWRSGMLSLILNPWKYGPSGFYRVSVIFEANVRSMFQEMLQKVYPNGYRERDCGFVQMIASNPTYAGKGYAAALFAYQMERHFNAVPNSPVILDTTTEQAIRSYEGLGFRVVAERKLDINTDEKGFKLKKGADEAAREAAKKVTVQRVMIKTPPEQ